MPLINESGTLGMIFSNASTTVTGNLFLTLFIVMLIIIALAIMFGIPLEFTAIIIFPMIIAAAGHNQQFLTIGLLLIIYFAMIIAKRWVFK